MKETLVAAALFLLPLGVVVLAYYMFLHRVNTPTETEAGIERFNQVMRGLMTISMLSGFLLLTWIGKIVPELYVNTFTMVLTFWFAKQMQQSNGGTKP